MASIDLEHLRQSVGRSRLDHDVVSLRHARLMAATLDRDEAALVPGAPLPPLWHWIYFLEGPRPGGLGSDGHAARGSFLPPVPLSNRMWAGGRIRFRRTVPLGEAADRRSTVRSVDAKHGRTGELVFVTVLHEILVGGEVAIEEEHDIVYKEAGQATGRSAPSRPSAPFREATWVRRFTPTSTTLFRYSALTFNGHRIHYDLDYCRNVEGYANLVVHGPLNATLLAGLAQEILGESRLRSFDYRCVQPALLGQALTLNVIRTGEGLELFAGLPDGSASVIATASSD